MPGLQSSVVAFRWRRVARPGGRGVTVGILVAVVMAWIAVGAMLASGAMPGGRADARVASGGVPRMAGMAGMAGMAMGPGSPARVGGHDSTLLDSGAVDWIAMWTLMVVAMMLPAALPAVRHVAVNSLRWRRRRAIAVFVAVYVSIWMAFGVALLAVSPLWSSIDSAAVLAVALALAAGWQMTGQKRRALRECHRPSPLPPRGPRATAGVIRFAFLNGLACLRSCWAMMFAMGVASSTMFFWMIAVTGIVTTEKLAQKPRQATRVAAALLAAGALVAGASTLIA